jgi:hypothetical protein
VVGPEYVSARGTEGGGRGRSAGATHKPVGIPAGAETEGMSEWVEL